jgi:hypothetical protein
MFDKDTVSLISEAQTLEGLNLEELPQRLTEAYAAIVAARIGFQEGDEDAALKKKIRDTVDEMRRIAFTHEAFVAAFPERANRVASAFVAGAAHHVCLLAQKSNTEEDPASTLGLESVSPAVSATLLFLIAESSADAAEMAKSINIRSDDLVEVSLLTAIINLANGRLQPVLDAPLPATDILLAAEPVKQATSALFYMLLKGIKALAAEILGVTPDGTLSATVQFENVKLLCSQPIADIFEEGTVEPVNIYTGPLHLASLLVAVSKDLPATALIHTPAPSGVDGTRWADLIGKLAKRRPYLWRNHREAIGAGYLTPGTSAVVSFPTGAGKSTLAELKIASALLRGVKVVFLAPTLALVDQTAKALAATFSQAHVEQERAGDFLSLLATESLPEISVMTPERCLAILSFDRDIFADFGLMIFDECHLLHPRDQDYSRRSVDAMLCLLNFTAVTPEADLLLLSAMMKNAAGIAGWIASISQRPCLALDLTWKPTRQVRGCVVYASDRIIALNTRLREARRDAQTLGAPASVRRDMTARPLGFFCLRQTWQSNAVDDYTLLPLLDHEVQLATATSTGKGKAWYLTPNGNEVASAIAAATATQNLKTLIFTQTIPLCNSAVKDVDTLLPASNVTLTDEEARLLNHAATEMGGEQHLYIRVAGGQLLSASACHHGLLLPTERNLHESLFKRSDGISVLAATSTLAQGMNLPSEVVLIAGDRRFDAGAKKMEQLEAHELLNAAGRAGRAGEGSYGFVLVVPGKVIHFDNETSNIHNYWVDLKAIFSQSDQCLDIEDPFTYLLDKIHATTEPLSALELYFLSRLPLDTEDETSSPGDPVREFLGRSYGAYQARQRADQAWIDSRIATALSARSAGTEDAGALTWIERLAAAAGVQVAIIRNLGDAITASPLSAAATTVDWRGWVFTWLSQSPDLIPQLIRRENLEGLFGKPYKDLTEDTQRGVYALPKIQGLLTGWMEGKTLAELEVLFGTPAPKVGKCENAREFVIRMVSEVAYIFGVVSQVVRAQKIDETGEGEIPLSIGTLGACVREGFDQVEKLILHYQFTPRLARIETHQKFDLIREFLPAASSAEDFARITLRLKAALATYELLS